MAYNRIIVKLGTSTLTGGAPTLDTPRMIDLVRQMTLLQSENVQVTLVTSGAIAAGREELDFPTLPKHIPAKQMLSAVGQPRLMAIYTEIFRLYGGKVAQVLLTKSDLNDRRRYLNARNTLESLLYQKVVPIVNENDTVSIDEIRFGDNDNLSAMLATLIEADLLLLLTDMPGLFTGDPRHDPQARLIEKIDAPQISPALFAAAGGSVSGLGTGGMSTKLRAADLARRSGCVVIIANGKAENVILRAAHGENPGTLFTPVTSTMESRKRFMLSGIRASSGSLLIDQGAANSLAQGSSLLPVGIRSQEGNFKRGDKVRIVDPSGNLLAVGIVNYDSKDVTSLCGKKSSEIEEILGYTYGEEVVHRNNMMVL